MLNILVEAPTIEEARTQARQRVPAGGAITAEEIISSGEVQTVDGTGDTVDHAVGKLEESLPDGAQILERKVIVVPEVTTLRIDALDADSACLKAEKRYTPARRAVFVDLRKRGRRGIFGIGRKPNRYNVQVLRLATVRLAYRLPARLRATLNVPDP